MMVVGVWMDVWAGSGSKVGQHAAGVLIAC